MIALGAPGALKSMLSLAWCLELDAPTRMISLDTDPATQAVRVIARLTGNETTKIWPDKIRWAGWLREQTTKLRIHSDPVSVDEVDEIVTADTEYWGQAPGLVVIDDVSKLVMEERDYSGFDTAMLELHRIARRHKTVVLALHHLHRGDSSARTKPIKLSDGKYTGEYEAEIVLGLWRPAEHELKVGVLKNRFGNDDPTGGLVANLHCDPALVDIRDYLDPYAVFNDPPPIELSEAGIRL